MIRVPIIDRPNQRSSHRQPVPRSGGVAIVVTTYVGLIAVFMLGDRFAIEETQLFGLGAGAIIVAVAGLLDDLNILQGFKSKLLLQILACIVVLVSGVLIDRVVLPFVGPVELGWWGFPVTLLWILGLTNIVNFMDGLDGLAAGTACMVAIIFGVITSGQDGSFVAFVSFVLSAGCAGFLLFNFPRAKIFMGDVGSQFLGFVLASVAVVAAGQGTAPISVFVIPLLFFHFIFDTVFTFCRRLLARENVTQAHRTHLYQLLNQIGCSHVQVSLLHVLITLAQGVGAMVLVSRPAVDLELVFLPFLLFQLVYAGVVLSLARRRNLI